MTTDIYCSVNSAQLGEPLYGTAVHVGVWFLLEYRAPWAAKATNDNNLPPAVQAWLNEQVATVPNGRLQFIKQDKKATGLTFFIAVMTGEEPIVYRFSLSSYEDLLSIDMSAIVNGDERYVANRHADPLYFVCTHGKRDICCAKFGLTFYNQLAAKVGKQAWQASHLGGHRFAVTLLTLPNGVNYGRLQPADIPVLIAAQADDGILLDRLRGQTRYSPMVQTADYFLRQQIGVVENGRLTFQEAAQTDENRWLVRFRSREGATYQVNLAQNEQPLQFLASCGKPKMKTVYPYQLAGIENGRGPLK
ncbi:MAG: sucrase ferredoxin [Chloroflexota bacterium]